MTCLLFGFLFLLNAKLLTAQTLSPSDGFPEDQFGRSVSVSGDIGVVAARIDDDNGELSGSAYVFRNLNSTSGNVTESVKLTASDGMPVDRFGEEVSIFGSTGLIGSRIDTRPGAAYVYRRLDTATGSVTESARLTASDGVAGDFFGRFVNLSGDTGVVGALGDNNQSGSAYVFRGLDSATGTVTESVKLIASDGESNDLFGGAVSVSDSIGLIGAFNDGDQGTATGSAYVFRDLDTATGTITESAKLTASDAARINRFGISTSLSGTTGLLGANTALNDGIRTGSAYVFRGLDTATGSVTESVKLLASDREATDGFGRAVSLSGSTGLVGAFSDNNNGVSSPGSAYLF